MKIMVTGGTGFIGSHLIEELIHLGHIVVVPYIEINPKSYFRKSKLGQKVQLYKVNLNDRKKIDTIIHDHAISYIFHLAARTIVTEAYDNPYTTLQDNIMGTVNILEAARNNKKIKGIIFASSDKAYGKTKTTYTEDSPLSGDHPYDVSKSAADLIAGTYFKTYCVPVVTARFGNVYGEGDIHMNRIIPGICEAIITKRTLQIRSDGKFIRDYIYVKDVVAGYIHLFTNLNETVGQAYNFSSKDTLSVLELINHAEKITGEKIKYTIKNTAVNEIPYQHLNDRKVRQTGWRAHGTIKSTFPAILEWYRRNVFTNS